MAGSMYVWEHDWEVIEDANNDTTISATFRQDRDFLQFELEGLVKALEVESAAEGKLLFVHGRTETEREIINFVFNRLNSPQVIPPEEPHSPDAQVTQIILRGVETIMREQLTNYASQFVQSQRISSNESLNEIRRMLNGINTGNNS